MTSDKTNQPKASAPPPVARNPDSDKKERVEKPAGNATDQLATVSDRDDARDEQTTLQNKGPNALPASDYPLKEQIPAANPEDKRQHNALSGTTHRGGTG